MKKLFVLIAMLALAAPAIAETILPFTVTVPASNSAVVRLSGKCSAVRMKTSTTGITTRFYEERRNSSGALIGVFASAPQDTVAGQYTAYTHHMVPSEADTVMTLDSESVSAWNVYNNVKVDIIILHNSNGTPQDVYVEAWR